MVKIVALDHVCRMQQVNDGCSDSFDEVPEKAITLTMRALLEIKEHYRGAWKEKAPAINPRLMGNIHRVSSQHLENREKCIPLPGRRQR